MKDNRLAKRFLTRAPDSLSDEDLLSLLLDYTDTALDSETLLQKFDGLCNLLDATAEDLVEAGAEEDTALLLRLVPELYRRYFLNHGRREHRLTCSADFGAYLLPHFIGEQNEAVYLLCLDALGRVLSCKRLCQGSAISARIPVRDLVQEALRRKAVSVVLAHNHPAGPALPSREDIEITRRLIETLEILELNLVDHIIVHEDDFVSLRESGYLRGY